MCMMFTSKLRVWRNGENISDGFVLFTDTAQCDAQYIFPWLENIAQVFIDWFLYRIEII